MKDKSKETETSSLILFSGSYDITLAKLAIPEVIQNILLLIKDVQNQKRTVNAKDISMFLPGNPLEYQITEQVSLALINCSKNDALDLWKKLSAELKQDVLIPDAGTVNIDIVNKLEITGNAVCHALLGRHSISPPKQTAYSYLHGNTSAEEAYEFCLALRELYHSKPNGRQLIEELFAEIDLKVLYLFGMSEAEQYASDDPNGGAYLQLSMEASDKMPEGVPLLAWIQEYVPDTFRELRIELLNPVWQENRALFWEGWLRQNQPLARSNRYEKPPLEADSVNYGIDSDDLLDNLMNAYEREDHD